MPYKHIFFDLDHTLWDFETNSRETLLELYQTHHLATRGILHFDEFLHRYSIHNDRLWDRFRKGFITRKELRSKRFWLTFLEYKIADEKLTQLFSEQFLEILPTKTALFPYTTEVLEYLLQKQYTLHLITNGFEDTQLMKLRNANIFHYFTNIITSEAAGSLKPHAAIFNFALQKSSAMATESIMIGDTLEVDILGAQQAGMDQIYFNPNVPATAIIPTYTIQHLQEIENIL
ncbi:putative hydrolase of the HAD superfamily [Chitinophaga costaii]|uniref:Putative hydrolase of the HAD superfamily n=1 Tax=Chitinophaga costaii TaxID=1335309 RepID=A0A1C4AM91_9BACT|nr:YjjG family noncanonical pyrimidine nucleotidase [Chitinophaga costaii]PUZ26666.1 noncanonical pyrimidine nucleotidase, YjjG family [Chitinophaga costaii]SCB95745.1 putative hydrolase of the HAD superfamily [Chitinophaga costaii]